MNKVRQTRVKAFLNIPFPKWKETWKCECGGQNSELVCKNYGQTKFSILHKKRMEKRQILDNELMEIFS